MSVFSYRRPKHRYIYSAAVLHNLDYRKSSVCKASAFKESKRSLHCTSQHHYAHAEASEYDPRIMS